VYLGCVVAATALSDKPEELDRRTPVVLVRFDYSVGLP
jgi:hypothetical protein